MGKHLSDAVIMSTLIETGNIRLTAEKLNLSAGTIRTRMRSPEFQAKYSQLRDDSLSDAAEMLRNRLETAIATLSDVMQDKEVSAQTRCNAACYTLQYALRFIEISDITRRIERLEAMAGGEHGEEVDLGTPETP